MINAEELVKELAIRISKLRIARNVSARDMSLSMGQGKSYINNIENGTAKPSLEGLFLICEYLNISPKDFFDMDNAQPEQLNEIIGNLKKLPQEQLQDVSNIVKGLIR